MSDFTTEVMEGTRFRASGRLSGKITFTDDTGEQKYYAKVDYVGGANNVEVDAAQYEKLPNIGTKMRIYGIVSQHHKTGLYAMKTNRFESEHDTGWKPFSLDELKEGAMVWGFGWIADKSDWIGNDNKRHNQVKIKGIGVMCSMTTDDVALYQSVPGNDTEVQFRGTLETSFQNQFRDGRNAGKLNVLKLTITKIAAISEPAAAARPPQKPAAA